MKNMEIKIRLAELSDAKKIWEIRNEPESRAVAASPEIIPLAQHISWFENKYFKQTGNYCFVGEFNGEVIGYCRFDLDGDHYLNSIAVSSSMHGKGIGTLILDQSIRQLPPRKILAEIRRYNMVSIKMFERVGFKKISENDQNLYFEFDTKKP